MERPRRTHAEARAQMREGILRLGNEQLAEVGAAALSVREIARGLGVASSAIYRHVANRDELLTLLIIDAYEDLAQASIPRAHELTPASPAEQVAEIARGMRAWAVANPARWALAYGTPVPGYQAPAEHTNTPGTRVMAAFLGVLTAGVLRDAPTAASVHASPAVSAALSAELAVGAAEFGLAFDPALGVAAIETWSSLVGMVSAEVFQQLGPDLAAHGEELLEHWIAATVWRFGLDDAERSLSWNRD